MATQICLLRGVNVGGKNRLAMRELAALFESLGYAEVTTYIQSGNVLFSSHRRVSSTFLEERIRDRFALSVTVVVRSATQMAEVIAADPFADRERDHVHVAFLATSPARSLIDALDPEPFEPERFVVSGTEVYLCLPNGMARTKLPSYLERRLKQGLTIRNWNTVTKLAELATGPLRTPTRPPRS